MVLFVSTAAASKSFSRAAVDVNCLAFSTRLDIVTVDLWIATYTVEGTRGLVRSTRTYHSAPMHIFHNGIKFLHAVPTQSSSADSRWVSKARRQAQQHLANGCLSRRTWARTLCQRVCSAANFIEVGVISPDALHTHIIKQSRRAKNPVFS